MKSEITPENREAVLEVVLSMYANEPCRICGVLLTRNDLNEAVYAGYSKDNRSRCAHGHCWNKGLPKEQWAYPEDDKSESQ